MSEWLSMVHTHHWPSANNDLKIFIILAGMPSSFTVIQTDSQWTLKKSL